MAQHGTAGYNSKQLQQQGTAWHNGAHHGATQHHGTCASCCVLLLHAQPCGMTQHGTAGYSSKQLQQQGTAWHNGAHHGATQHHGTCASCCVLLELHVQSCIAAQHGTTGYNSDQ
eukprot:1158537-Pelagomonas_calceolata.AAC.23